MKIKNLSSFERKFVKRLRELTVGIEGKDLARWQERALQNFEEHRPYTLQESEWAEERYIDQVMMCYQCSDEEVILAAKEGRSPRPHWETNPENFEPDPESNIPF